MADALLARTRALRSTRLSALVLGRLVEQTMLGAAALVLAAALGPDDFAPVSILFVVNSVAVTLSHYGVGMAVLRCAPGSHVSMRAFTSMRLANAALAVAGAVLGLAIGGTIGTIVAASGVVWWASSEAFVRKGAAISLGATGQAARGEIAGALAFGALVAAAASSAHEAVALVGAAFVAKHVVEAACVRTWRPVFARDGQVPELGALWLTQGLALVAGNVDYLLVGVFFGARAFSVYTLGFRVAVALPSVLAYSAGRLSVADLGAAGSADVRAERYLRYVRPLFVAGVAGALAAAIAGTVLPAILGDAWDAITPTVLVLAVAMPWRMIVGQSGALMLSVRSSGRLAWWELARVAVFAALLAVGGALGYGAFVACVSLGWIVTTTLLHVGATREAGVPGWDRLTLFGFAGAALVVGLAASLSGWLP